MNIDILKCPKCSANNRVKEHSSDVRPICGRCGTVLYDPKITVECYPKKTNPLVLVSLWTILFIVVFAILYTPILLKGDYSSIIASEEQITISLEEELEKRLLAKKAELKKEVLQINAEDLRENATRQYQKILAARHSFDERYALSPREKAQLQMYNLSSESAKAYHDTIRSIAKQAAPEGADIRIEETFSGIKLHIDFDMSSMTSGEQGIRTKHTTIDSLKKEVIYLISRVSNDVFQFCAGLDINSIYIGCRHYVKTEDVTGKSGVENTLLYKIRIQKRDIKQLENNPFLDIYAIGVFFEIDEDNFDTIEIFLE